MSRPESKYESVESERMAAEAASMCYAWKKLRDLTINPVDSTFKTGSGLSVIEINAYWKSMCESFFDHEIPKRPDDEAENFYFRFVKQYSKTLDRVKAGELNFTDVSPGFKLDTATAFLAEICNRYSVIESRCPISNSPVLWRMLINKDPSYVTHWGIPDSLRKEPAMIKVKVDYAISYSNSDKKISFYRIPIDEDRLKKITQGLLELKTKRHSAHRYACLQYCELDKFFLSSLAAERIGDTNLLGSFFKALPESIPYLWMTGNDLGSVPECSRLIQKAFSCIPPHVSFIKLTDNQLAKNDGVVLENILIGLNQARNVDSLCLGHNNLHALSHDRLVDIFIKLPQSISSLTLDGGLHAINPEQLTAIIESIPLSVKHISMYFDAGSDNKVLFDKLMAKRQEKVSDYFQRLEAGEQPPRHLPLYGGSGGGGGEGCGDGAARDGAESKSAVHALTALSVTSSSPKTETLAEQDDIRTARSSRGSA